MSNMKLDGRFAPLIGPIAGVVFFARFKHWNFDEPLDYGLCAMFGGIGLVAGLIVWFLDSRRKPAKEE